MKKVFLVVFALSAAFLFTSCGDFWENLFGNITGSATSDIAGERSEYASSIAMNGTNAGNPFVVGLAMNMDISELLEIGDANDLEFPLLCYRLSGNNIKSGATLTADNTLTDEDLVDFDYTTLISGKFADNQVVGIAVSPDKYYVMSKGYIKLDKVKKTKITGSFSGWAYVIDRTAEPMLSENQVIISGKFVSRVTPMMAWVKRLQEKK